MRTRFIIFAFLLLFIIVPTSAQDDDSTEYRLREPSVEAYLSTIPQASSQWSDDVPLGFAKVRSNPLADIMSAEFGIRFNFDEVSAQPFDQLLSAFQSLDRAYYSASSWDGVIWLESMLEAWLRETELDLDTNPDLQIDGFSVEVTPVDFNADGVNEYILALEIGSYSSLRVLQVDEARFRLIDTPLGWHTYNYLPMMGEYIHDEIVEMADINADGLPEWLLFSGLRANFQTCGRLKILSWRNGELVNIIEEGNLFCVPSPFEIENLDSDPALEIRQNDLDGDNWRCRWMLQQTLDWNGEQYVLQNSETLIEDTLGCVMREAEQLLWENNAENAIPIYEAGLQLGFPEEQTTNNPVYYAELEQYAQIRLALAYALVGRVDEAINLLNTIQTEGIPSIALEQMVDAMLQAERNPLAMCVGAYNVFDEYDDSFHGYIYDYITIVIGRLDNIQGMMDNYPPEAALAGCNAPPLIDALLAETTFSSSESPVAQLEALNIDVQQAQQFDLNNDGVDGWLVWTVARVEPLFFAPSGDDYRLSRVEMSLTNDFTAFWVQSLPESDETIFVRQTFMDSTRSNQDWGYYDVPDHICVSDDNTYLRTHGVVELWDFDGDTLQIMLSAPMCHPRAQEDIFSDDGRELYASAIVLTGNGERYDEVIYQWDIDVQNYIPPEPIIEESIFVPVSDSTSPYTDAYIFAELQRLRNAINNGSYAEVLVSLDDLAENIDPSVDIISINGIRYYRALAYEYLNRPDEALAEYITIYESAPESAWGMLARLHLDIVE